MKRTTLIIVLGWLLALPLSAESEKEDLEIPMRDGAKLAADLFLPGDYSKEKYPNGLPTILIITPYNKDRENAAELWRETMVRNGYAFVAQDMRGFYGSRGDAPGAARHGDGYDTIEWIATQPWSNGKVGMMGYSHLGAVQYETAVTTPPHLACAIPAQAPGNYYTDSYFPPKFRKADMETLLRGEFTSRTQQLINRRIRSRETSQISKINAPMLHSAGWFDFYKEGAIEMFNALQKDGGPGVRGQQKLLIGPWGHGVLQEENPGTPLRLDSGHTFPANAKLEWETNVWLPWFDHWVKGMETGVMKHPAVVYYLMGAIGEPGAPGNRWIAAEDFPPKSTSVSYYAHSDCSLKTVPPNKESDSIQYVYDPRNWDRTWPDQATRGRSQTDHRELDPGLAEALQDIMEGVTRGDPESPLRWTCKSTRELAKHLHKGRHPLSHTKVAQLLHDEGYSLQANRKSLEGTDDHPDRDAQFRYINSTASQCLAEGLPVISVDTKKKELVGNYHNEGREWRPAKQPRKVQGHDFPGPEIPRAYPYGIYDIGRNRGFVNIGTDHDTGAFAVASIRGWWRHEGRRLYRKAPKILITADGGGSNGSRLRLWKYELQKFADETGLEVSVCHFPPGTSKWNKIEHRLFSFISSNWRGQPLQDYETIVNLIASTTTAKGLTVTCRLDRRRYPTGRKISDEEMESVRLERHSFHGDWNYTIKPH